MKKLFKSITTNWKTTIAGILSAVISILVFTDVIPREDQNLLEQSLTTIIDNVEAIILAVVAIIGIFSRDGDKSSEDSQIK